MCARFWPSHFQFPIPSLSLLTAVEGCHIRQAEIPTSLLVCDGVSMGVKVAGGRKAQIPVSVQKWKARRCVDRIAWRAADNNPLARLVLSVHPRRSGLPCSIAL